MNEYVDNEARKAKLVGKTVVTIPGKEILLDGEYLGNPAGAFWLYGGIAFLALIWGYFYIPETKGVTLEQIENFWRMRKSPRELK